MIVSVPHLSGGHFNLDVNRALFKSAETLVRLEAALRRQNAAVLHADAACRLAAWRHPGCFTSLRLERSLEDLGRSSLPWPATGSDAGARIPASVLHVMTKPAALGGHTHWVRRIIEGDATRRHSLALSDAAIDCVPDDLAGAVRASGGDLIELSSAGGSWRRRARRLQAAHLDHDITLLSTDPGDAIPSLALADRPAGRAVVRLNHADHIFWIGTSVTDVLVEFRPAGAICSASRRGYPAWRQRLLPLPVEQPLSGMSREAARSRMGLAPESFVVLTVGSAYKFEALGGPAFLDLVEPALSSVPQLVLIVVGPTMSGRWSVAARTWGDRLLVLPGSRDLSAYFAGADAFLNPAPIGSDTLMWEAASFALPVVMMQPDPPELALVRGDPDEFGGAALAARDSTALADVLSRLARDPSYRRERGVAASAVVEQGHIGNAWSSRLDSLWESACGVPSMSADELGLPGVRGPVDVELAARSRDYSLRNGALRLLRRRGARSAKRGDA